jgi:hypothetical protein
MKLYHVTTTNRYSKSIQANGLVPGGMDLTLTEREAWEEAQERRFAGANFCQDSDECVCLSALPDGRYGAVTLWVSSKKLEASKLVILNADAWEAGSERISLDEFLAAAARNDDESQELIMNAEIRYYGQIPAKWLHVGK